MLGRPSASVGVGVSVQTTYRVHRLDEDFFAEFEFEEGVRGLSLNT